MSEIGFLISIILKICTGLLIDGSLKYVNFKIEELKKLLINTQSLEGWC
jgi:hypothetical protein